MMPDVPPEVCRSCRAHRSPAATASGPAPGEGAATLLPNDLVFDILSRLPVRSVCRFRCVSMEWSTLISDPAFAAAHNSNHAEPLIVVGHFKGKSDLQLMDMNGNIVRAVQGTYGFGLISTSIDYLVCVRTGVYGGIRVIDPASGRVLLDCQHAGLYGFGRAVPSEAYKVVRIKNRVCMVLTLGEGTKWRLLRSAPSGVYDTGKTPVVVNGVMYFSVMHDMHNFSFSLHRFDLESEEWKKTIQSPEITVSHNVLKRTNGIRVAELNRALCIVQSEVHFTLMTSNDHVNIWLLTDPDKGIWIKAYTIAKAACTYNYMPLRVTHDGGKLIFHRTHTHKELAGELQVYNFVTKTCTLLWKLDEISDNIGLCSLNLDRFV